MAADAGYPRPYADVSTLRGALDHLTEAVAAQVEESVLAGAAPNTSIPGDARVRDAELGMESARRAGMTVVDVRDIPGVPDPRKDART